MGWEAEDDYDATYGKAQAKIRRRLKDELMAEATMGTKAGQWSARKSQELKRRYEAACERAGLKPYKGSKTAKQKDLSDWSDQDWRTSSGGKSSVTGEPYFPAKAVEALKERDLYAKAKRQKAAATRAGKQRATYSKDIQAVVARYRAEDDHTLDDLDDQTIINRMEHIGERMAEIVQKHGGSYQNAERDPEYLRLARDHHALARVFVRRHGNIDMDAEYVEPPMDLEEEAEARLEAIRQLQWGLRVIDRMLTEGNIDEAIAFTRATVDAMDQEEAADRDLGLDPDRFSAEDGSDSGCGNPDHWDCNSCFEVCLDCHPSKIGGQDSLGENLCMDCVAQRMARKEPCECGSTLRCMECLECVGCQVRLYESGDYGMVCTGCAPNVFDAEGDASFTPDPDLPLTEQARDQYMFMMPDGSTLWIHNQDWAVGMADMKPTWDPKRLSDYGGTPTTVTYMSLGAVDPADYTDFIPEWRPGMSFPPEDMVDQWIDPSRLGEAHNEFTKQYETSFWPGLSLREILGRYDGGNPVFDAEDDPVSRIAAGTNDALADFANAHDTDDGFYFAGGLIGGLAIAVAGNIIANHVQRWIDARRSGSS